MIKIRQAEEVDLPEIMKLYELLFAYSATLQPDYFQAAGQQYDFCNAVCRIRRWRCC